MPDDLAAKVREYVSGTDVERDDERDETLTWATAIWHLKHALAWRQEHGVWA